jgi:hypothetical protein
MVVIQDNVRYIATLSKQNVPVQVRNIGACQKVISSLVGKEVSNDLRNSSSGVVHEGKEVKRDAISPMSSGMITDSVVHASEEVSDVEAIVEIVS